MASSARLTAAALLVVALLPPTSAAAVTAGNDGGDDDNGHDYNDDGNLSPGSIAYPGQFPWHVAVVNRDSNVPPYFDIVDLLGSGVLISQSYVLTAASAVAAAAKADAVDVWLGAAWLTLEHGGGQVVQAVSVTRHAQWNGTTAENDIATVKLQVAVIKSDRISPVRLPPSYYKGATYVDQTLSVSSWGYADQYNSQAFLSVYNFNVIRNRDCQNMQEDTTKAVPWTKLCAVAAMFPNPCKRDVGDPAVYLEEDGVYTLVGIVSGDSQCDIDAPARLTRVTELLDWIQANSDAKIE